LRKLPEGIFATVRLKLGDKPDRERADARAALAHLHPTEM
jgi:hypothetical protein